MTPSTHPDKCKNESLSDKRWTTKIIKDNGNWGHFICDNCNKRNECSLMTSIRIGLTNALNKSRIKCIFCNKFNKVNR
jgi:hypothetical protein